MIRHVQCPGHQHDRIFYLVCDKCVTCVKPGYHYHDTVTSLRIGSDLKRGKRKLITGTVLGKNESLAHLPGTWGHGACCFLES